MAPTAGDPSIPKTLLHRPAADAARLVALKSLDDAHATFKEDHDLSDGDALHEFRVAIRELRSTIRAFRAEFGESIPRATRRELRKLARCTGSSRDLEVQLQWLDQQEPLSDTEEPGRVWLSELLQRRKDESDAHELRQVNELCPHLHKGLHAALRAAVDAPEKRRHSARPSFAAVLGRRLSKAIADMREGIDAVRSIDDQKRAHRARIRGKRLRYLLAPILGIVPVAKPLVTRLKRFQDILGDMHDAHVLRTEVTSLMQSATVALGTGPEVPPAGAIAGLAELERRLAERERR